MWEDIKKKNFIHMGDWANLAKQQINVDYNEDKKQQNEEYNEDKEKKKRNRRESGVVHVDVL